MLLKLHLSCWRMANSRWDEAFLGRYVLPLAELGGNFYDSLKSITSGYASFDYEEGELRKADLVRLDLMLNGEAVDALARIVHR